MVNKKKEHTHTREKEKDALAFDLNSEPLKTCYWWQPVPRFDLSTSSYGRSFRYCPTEISVTGLLDVLITRISQQSSISLGQYAVRKLRCSTSSVVHNDEYMNQISLLK